ncbi:MAG TPA: ABC transporter permease subunit [Candidatus Blautia merdigallinarum]|uniref:ABC transporter permease subunit n=1 Tax=Candidatus Blautia merdigallinarum TaxID=2838495 RepID=A0A9D2N538_9FIRM|nr:ABC transporter permease subunit [Candidatus Blautia merdigallinarum]
MKKTKRKTYLFALLPFLILVGLFEILPILSIIIRSFMPQGGAIGITLENYIRIFTTKLYQSAIINSLFIAVCSSVIGLAVAFLGAKAAYEKGGRAKKIFMSILNMVSNFSGVPLAFAYIIMLGNTGVFTLIGQKFGIGFLAEFPLYSVVGLMITYIYFQILLAALLLIPAFESIKKEWKDAVGLLGGSSRTFWFKVGLPVLMPSILGTFSTMFSNAISAYATAYALVMNNLSILPIRISEQFVGDVVQNPQLGGALAVVLMLLMVLSIVINEKILQGNRRVKHA